MCHNIYYDIMVPLNLCGGFGGLVNSNLMTLENFSVLLEKNLTESTFLII